MTSEDFCLRVENVSPPDGEQNLDGGGNSSVDNKASVFFVKFEQLNKISKHFTCSLIVDCVVNSMSISHVIHSRDSVVFHTVFINEKKRFFEVA